MVDDSKDSWPLIAKILGAGGLFALVAGVIRALISVWKAPKTKADEHERIMAGVYAAQIRALYADIDRIRDEYDERIKRHVDRGHSLANEVQVCRSRIMALKAKLIEMGCNPDDLDEECGSKEDKILR
jgi:hypothetical protein